MDFRLPFLSPQLGEEFFRRRASRGARVFRLLSYAGLVLVLSYSLLEYVIDAPCWRANLVIRGLGVIVLFGHVRLLPPRPDDRQLDVHVCRHIALVALLVCVLLVRMPYGFTAGMPGLTQLLLLGSLIFARSRRVPWLLSSVALIGVSMWWSDGVTSKLMVTHLTSLLLGLGMAWIVAALQESALRRAFLLEKKLEMEATTDTLTGLLNRRAVTRQAEEELLRSDRYKRQLTLLLLDIDHFKQVNDRYGHDVGDEAIKFLSSTCLRSLRSSDRVARWGGEEFLILLPETTAENGHMLAERLRASVESRPLQTPAGPLQLTISVGLAGFRHGQDLDQMVKRADEALYEAKQTGRNRVRCSTA